MASSLFALSLDWYFSFFLASENLTHPHDFLHISNQSCSLIVDFKTLLIYNASTIHTYHSSLSNLAYSIFNIQCLPAFAKRGVKSHDYFTNKLSFPINKRNCNPLSIILPRMFKSFIESKKNQSVPSLLIVLNFQDFRSCCASLLSVAASEQGYPTYKCFETSSWF